MLPEASAKGSVSCFINFSLANYFKGESLTLRLPFSARCEGEGDRREGIISIVVIYIGAVEGLHISTRSGYQMRIY